MKLKDQYEAAKDATQAIYDTAKAEGRDMTASERTSFEARAAEAKELRSKWEQHLSDKDALDELGDAISPNAGAVQHRKGGSLGSGGAGLYKAATSLVNELKAVHSASGQKALTVAGSAGLPFAAMVNPQLPTNAMYLSQLLPVEEAPAGQFSYLRQTTRTNLAAPVDIGALKPTSTFGLERITDNLLTIAHLSEQIPRQYVEDEASLVDFLASELLFGLLVAIDNQIVNGDGAVGAPPTELTGLMNLAGVPVQAFDTNMLRSLRIALSKLAIAGIAPDPGNAGFSGGIAIAMHPTDWATIELMAGSTGEYLAGGPVGAGAERRLWGIPVVPTISVPLGWALVGDFSTIKLMQRGPIQVDWTEAVSDDFARNYLRFRCEVRVGLAIPKPTAFIKVDLVL